MLKFQYHLPENGKDVLEDTANKPMRALRTDADGHSADLKAFVVQLFQHSFSFKVIILMVKRVELQRVFSPPERGS